jgi:hypothetical protein
VVIKSECQEASEIAHEPFAKGTKLSKSECQEHDDIHDTCSMWYFALRVV